MRIKKKLNIIPSIKKHAAWISLAVFLSVTVFLTIETGTTGAEVLSLERKADELLQINRELSESLIGTTSLGSIGKKSEELGFSEPEVILYVAGEKPVAKLP